MAGDIMRWRLILCAIATLVQSSYALAQSHDEICVMNAKGRSIVSPEKFAKAILNQNTDAQTLYIKADAPASNPKYRPQWRRIFTDPDFCSNNPGCLSKNDKGKLDDSAAKKTLAQLRFAVGNFIQTQTKNGTYYRAANSNIGTDYLLDDNPVNPIYCVGPELPAVAKAPPGITIAP